MQKKRTVVFVNHCAKPGGAELALLRLVCSMDSRKWNPVVVFGEEGPMVSRFRDRCIECYVLPMGRKLSSTRKESLGGSGLASFGRAAAAARYVRELRNFLKERGADIVHTNSMKAHVMGAIAAKLSRIPVVWHLRDTIDSSYLPQQAVRLMRILARFLPKHVVCVSQSVAISVMGGDWRKRGSVVYDGMDVSKLRQKNKADELVKGRLWRVGMVGRLSPWKGQHVLVDAIADLLSEGMDLECEILGSAMFGEREYEKALKQKVQSLGIEDRVRMRGFVENIPEKIRDWDVLIHASTSGDPCPNVVIEGLLEGVPVIGSAGGGVPELLEGGRVGELHPMGEAGDLAVAIKRLLLNPGRRRYLAEMGKETAKRRFDERRVPLQLEAVWESVAQEKTWHRRNRRWVEEGMLAKLEARLCKSGAWIKECENGTLFESGGGQR